jgi:hypothetical protein
VDYLAVRPNFRCYNSTNDQSDSSVCILWGVGFMAAISAPAMISHVFITQPPISNEQFDPWYLNVHAQECLRFFGPWLKRYDAFHGIAMPSEAHRPDAYSGRYMELCTTASKRGERPGP